MKRIFFLFIALVSINLQADKDRYITLKCVFVGNDYPNLFFMFVLDKDNSTFSGYMEAQGPNQPVVVGNYSKTPNFYLLEGEGTTVVSVNRNTLRVTSSSNDDSLDCISIDVPKDYLEYAKNKKRI